MPTTPETVVDEQLVASSNEGIGIPKIVTLPNGNIILAYSVRIDGDIRIKGQLFNPDGEKLGPEFLLSTINITSMEFDIAVSDNGNVGVVTEMNSSDFPLATRIFSITEDGATLVGNNLHEAEGGGFRNADYFNATIVAVEDGSFRTQWIERDARGNLQVEGERTGADGDNSGFNDNLEDHDIKSFNGNTDAEVESVLLRNGNHVIILDRDGATGNRDEIHYRVMKPNERTHAEGESGDNGSGDRTFDTTVEALKGGGFVIAWAADDGFDTDVRFQIFNEDGEPVTGPTTAGNTGGGTADNNNEPSLVALQDGGFLLLWDKDGGARGVMGQRFDAEGNPVGEMFRVTSDNAVNIDATLLANGNVAISWEVFGADRIEMEIVSGASSDAEDDLTGTDLDDLLDGQGGDDEIDGGRGDDEIHGGAGDDTLDGGRGDDEIHGGAGDDTLDGGRGDDVLYGGSGSDTFVIGQGDGDDEIRGFNATNDDEKIDLSDFAAIPDFFALRNRMDQVGDDVRINLGDDQTLILRSVDLEDLDAEDFILRRNSIEGTDADELLTGTDGDDVIRGLGGDDTITGGGGRDILYGGTGSDTFAFNVGDGNDQIRGFNATDDNERIDLTSFSDITDFDSLKANHMRQSGPDVEIAFGNGDWLVLRSVDIDDLDAEDFILAGQTFTGTNDGDILTGTDGGDVINGLRGKDQISGGAGDDLIDGGQSADTIDAGSGNDTVFGGTGTDFVDLGSGNDIFHDDAQNESIGDDTVFGGAGDDTFHGAGGNDVFTGGTGNDVAYAGIGSETFVFATGDGQDSIYQFDTDADVIDLSGVEAITGFEDLIANHLIQPFQSGGVSIVDDNGLIITLFSIDFDDLRAENFLF